MMLLMVKTFFMFHAVNERVGVDGAENSFVVKSSRLWNDLPEKLCSDSNIKSVKIALKTMYLEG